MGGEVRVRVMVLGPVRAWVGDEPADLGARLQRSLLARLVLAHGHTVSVDRLIDDLWEGEPPPKALAALQVYISHLRRALEPGRQPRTPASIVVSAAPGYCLRLPVEAVDSWSFEVKMTEAQGESDPQRRVSLLDEALAGWSGDPFAEVGDAMWAAAEVARLTELRLAAVEARAAAQVELGRHGTAVAALERHVADHPGREGAAAVLATALYRTGRQADALDVLRRTREHLLDELGLEPGRMLRDLERDILRQADHLEPAQPLSSPQPAVPETPENTAPDRAELAAYGRSRELAVIDDAARAVIAGGNSVLWIGGEAGSGKTTLARAAMARLQAAGWRTVQGSCPEVDGAPAGWAWTEVLRQLVDPAMQLDDKQMLAPLLHDGAAAEPGTFWLGHAVADVLGAVASRQPLAVVLDDLHRTDGLTLELLRLVADRIKDLRVLIIGTYRPSEDRGELEVARAALTVHTAAHVTLPGLDAAATATLAADCGLTGVSGEALRLLRERTGGNPLFVRELARLMAAEGTDAVWASVPVGVRDVLRRRLARLPGQTVTALRQAAVLGREVDVDLLAELARRDPDHLLDALEPAVLLGLLDEPEPGRLRFTHGLVRDTLYEDTSKLRRSRLHAAALELLRAPGRSVDPAALAHHAVASATAESALAAAAFAATAARDADSVGAYAESARQWRAAVQMLELAAGRQLVSSTAWLDNEIEVRCGLISALAQSGDAVAARVEMKCALQLLSGTSRDDLRVRVLTAWDTPLVWRDREYDESDTHMIGLLRGVLANSQLTPADRIRLLKALFVELEGADPDGALAVSTELLELARHAYAEDPGASGRLLCTALNVRAYCSLGPDLDAERDSIAAELLRIAEATEQADYQAVGHWLLSLAAGNRSDLVSAKQHVDLAVARAGTGQLLHLLGVLGLFRARMYLLAGRLDEAVSSYTDLAARMVENGAANGAKLAMVGRVTGEFCLGDLGLLADELLFFYREVSVAALDAAVLALIARGREDEARRLWQDRQPIERAYFWLPFTVLRVNAAVVLGDLSEVRARSAELAPYSGRIAGLGVDGLMVGPVDEALAIAADALGRPDQAERHREAAAALRDQLAAEARHLID
ncbi:DNA-binding SARP family transcriptional activator/RecA/RadA recombinase [Mycobacterium frederiksbergense]|uniref:DNA-binding SARP family transcriptional activator/RecA/RadA recombinase n=1 Tax=Mycolicibacterium frederiksbergense TaxID=117567 RepID=A0ABT6KX91_9MYCO|nr:BTAD domain-containing putative transcriptional regulator [Mycolicibacterium frederiksbergense]MDH6195327.1 DNA-binding SARP family transcriptional activator/RecA/RadA recombinase [Mycolicibacterium frederiksbergense]